MTQEVKDCYNQLLSIYLTSEDDSVFLELLANLEDYNDFNGSITWGKDATEICDQLSFNLDIKIEALKVLVKMFNIKPRPITVSGIWATGSSTYGK